MKLHLVRHLPTALNLKKVLQGSMDEPVLDITPELQLEIDSTKNKLDTQSFDKVFCSTLLRTHQTAAAYQINEFEKSPLIDEVNFGKYQGQSVAVFLQDHGEAWKTNPKTLVLGESMVDFETRLINFVEACKAYDNVLVFAHGGVIRALKSIYHFGSIEKMNKYHVTNNELVVLDFSQKAKRILILGGSKDQLPMVKLAKEYGMHTIVADFNPASPAKKIADQFHLISIKDQDEVKRIAELEKVDGIVSMITEAGVLAIYNSCEALGLPNSYSHKSAEATLSKKRMREILEEAQINDLPFTMPKTLTEACGFADKAGYPLVMKSSDSGGQNGLFKVNSEKELKTFFPISIQDSIDQQVILEKFAAGPEVNVVYTVFDGEVKDLIISDREKDDEAFGIVKRHTYPSVHSETIFEDIKLKCQRITKALDIKNAVVFPQFIYSEKDRQTYLLEIGVRIPGGIMDQLMHLATGLHLEKYCLDIALDQLKEYESYRIKKSQPAGMVTFLNAEPGPLKLGVITKQEGIEQARKLTGVFSVDYFFQTANQPEITPLKKGKDRFLHIVTFGADRFACHTCAKQAYDGMRFYNAQGDSLIKENFNFDNFFNLKHA